eukprot:6213588-Pleurochrysis_carterae.AAC.10
MPTRSLVHFRMPGVHQVCIKCKPKMHGCMLSVAPIACAPLDDDLAVEEAVALFGVALAAVVHQTLQGRAAAAQNVASNNQRAEQQGCKTRLRMPNDNDRRAGGEVIRTAAMVRVYSPSACTGKHARSDDRMQSRHTLSSRQRRAFSLSTMLAFQMHWPPQVSLSLLCHPGFSVVGCDMPIAASGRGEEHLARAHQNEGLLVEERRVELALTVLAKKVALAQENEHALRLVHVRLRDAQGGGGGGASNPPLCFPKPFDGPTGEVHQDCKARYLPPVPQDREDRQRQGTPAMSSARIFEVDAFELRGTNTRVGLLVSWGRVLGGRTKQSPTGCVSLEPSDYRDCDGRSFTPGTRAAQGSAKKAHSAHRSNARSGAELSDSARRQRTKGYHIRGEAEKRPKRAEWITWVCKCKMEQQVKQRRRGRGGNVVGDVAALE